MPSLNTVIKQASRGADLYFVFRFLRLLTMKWEKTDAYKYGIIDKKGKILRKSSDLEGVDEKASYSMLHRMVFKIRRLIEKVPIIGKTILTNYAAALFLLKEQNDTRIWTDDRYMGRKLMEFLENGGWEDGAELLREEIKNQYGFEESMSFLTEGKKDLPPHLQKLIKDLEKKQKELEKKGLKVKTFVYNPDTGKPDIELKERKMTDAEKDKREKIVLDLKKKKKDFQDKYGDEWEDVMYATATKMAMGEEVDEAFYDKVTIPQINAYLRGLSRMLSNKDLIDHLKKKWNLKKIKFNPTYTKILAIEERDMKSFTEFQEVEIDEAVLADKDYKYDGKVVKISKKNFSKVHKDFKNSTKGKERMMINDPKTGGSISVPVQFEEIANSVGGGNVAGLGVGPQGEPGKPKKKKKDEIDEAVILGSFAGKQVFVVDSDTFHQCRLGKKQYARYEKYVGKKGVGLAIREYGLKFPKRPIILQNGENGPMLYLRYGRS